MRTDYDQFTIPDNLENTLTLERNNPLPYLVGFSESQNDMWRGIESIYHERNPTGGLRVDLLEIKTTPNLGLYHLRKKLISEGYEPLNAHIAKFLEDNKAIIPKYWLLKKSPIIFLGTVFYDNSNVGTSRFGTINAQNNFTGDAIFSHWSGPGFTDSRNLLIPHIRRPESNT